LFDSYDMCFEFGVWSLEFGVCSRVCLFMISFRYFVSFGGYVWQPIAGTTTGMISLSDLP
jgi:hypothetical protein